MLKNIILFEAAITMEDTVRWQEDSDFAVLDRTYALLWQAAIVIPLSQRTTAEDWPLEELRSLVPEKQGNHRFPAVSGETGRQLAIDLTLFATSRPWLTDKRGGTEEAGQMTKLANHHQLTSFPHNHPYEASAGVNDIGRGHWRLEDVDCLHQHC